MTLLYTNSVGERYFIRGGPQNSGMGLSHNWGTFVTQFGPNVAGTIDYIDGIESYTARETVAQGADLSQLWGRLRSTMEEFGDAGIPYSPIVVNSNTGVREALAREGLGPLEQDGAYPSPGLIRFDPSLGIPTLIHVLGLSIEVFIQQVVSPLLRTTKDPLILDLDGDGMELTALAGSTAHFDFGQDGFAERTGWVAPDDGILVIDDNANGTVDGAAELFGSPTQDGFEVLETLDTNQDGKITLIARLRHDAARPRPSTSRPTRRTPSTTRRASRPRPASTSCRDRNLVA